MGGNTGGTQIHANITTVNENKHDKEETSTGPAAEGKKIQQIPRDQSHQGSPLLVALSHDLTQKSRRMCVPSELRPIPLRGASGADEEYVDKCEERSEKLSGRVPGPGLPAYGSFRRSR
jgi:hypothetical protein